VRNGSISGFGFGVNLEGDGSIVEGVRFSGGPGTSEFGITARGIVKNNTVVGGFTGGGGGGTGISASGIVTGNYVTAYRFAGFEIGQGSTVTGNTALSTGSLLNVGISVSCPSNVTDNTAINNEINLQLRGTGCNNTNNVAP
jgi:hypothetical protein